MSLWSTLVGLVCLTLAALSRGEEGDVLAKEDFLSGSQSWKLVGAGWSNEGLMHEANRIVASEDREKTDKSWWYASSPSFYKSNAADAYNGWLKYTLGHFEYEDQGSNVVSDYDVILVSKRKRFSVGLKGVFQVSDNTLMHEYQVRLEETFQPNASTASWELVNGKKGKPTKFDFVQCLSNLAEIRIRGSYFKGHEVSFLQGVSIVEGRVDKSGRYEGWAESGGTNQGAEYDLINGVKVYRARKSSPASSTTCCASKTCTTSDRMMLYFDRPGCMMSSDPFCSSEFAQSKAAEIVQGTSLNEGRIFELPPPPITCKRLIDSHSSLCNDGIWEMGTHNQNMGLSAIPLTKPFMHSFYFNSVPQICSSATLTVEVHGDLQYAGDSILVYGEDGAFLGSLFNGNLTYMEEGQRPYDPSGPQTVCRSPSVRGGSSPDAAGNTNCKDWVGGGTAEPSSQGSVALPYRDSIVISQSAMLRYSSDEQIMFAFKSIRNEGLYTGTADTASTAHCHKSASAAGCSLDGRVIFRSLKLSFAPGLCFSKRIFPEDPVAVDSKPQDPFPFTIPLSFSIPKGKGSIPSGDGVISVVAGALLTIDSDNSIEAFVCPGAAPAQGVDGCTYVGRMFDRSPVDGLQSSWAANPMLPNLLKEQYANVTDTLTVPRDMLEPLVVGDQVGIVLRLNGTGNRGVRISPISFAYPLMSCFHRTLTSGPNFKKFLERPKVYSFSEDGFPVPAGEVTMTVAAKWGLHTRYSGLNNCRLDGGKACGGNLEGMPKLRVDKDTLDNLGVVTVWREEDGTECCPSSQADSITNVVWGTGKLENCSKSMKLSVSGGSGSGFSADIADITPLGSISSVTITNNGRGYTSDPSLLASDAKCRCTPQTFTCSSDNSGSAMSPGTRGISFASADTCVSSCLNVDGSNGLCCPPGSQASLDGDIPVCNPPVSLPGNVAGNLDSCIRPVRTGCGGLSICSASAKQQQENVIRRLYPELVEQHRKWPHGFNYLQVHAGYEGEALGNLFLKDYTQYSPHSFYVDSIKIPADSFKRAMEGGRFEFSISTPPGNEPLEIAAIIIGYPVLDPSDAQLVSKDSVDLTDLPSDYWLGPAPSFVSSAWSGQGDPEVTSQATSSTFQQPSYQGSPIVSQS